ncbi:MAG: TolC family outer membrane protein [Gammaproteobacteria bacterium]|nr:TolC family outer membrane protein [Gammaproteobacteria bacterium]
MPQFRRIICAVAAAAAAVALCAPAQAADDLWTLYKLSLNNDAAYRKALLDHQAERMRVPLARTALGPAVDGSAQHGRVRARRNQGDGSSAGGGGGGGRTDFDESRYSLDLTQPLYNAANFSRYRQAQLQARAADHNLDRARQDLIVRIADRYFGLLSAGDNLTLSRSEVAAIDSQLARARQRLAVGLDNRTAVFEAKARFELARVGEIRAANAVEDARRGLMELVDVPPEDPVPLAEDAELAMPQPQSEDEWVALAAESNPDIRAVREQAAIAQREIKVRRGERHPNFDLRLSHSYTDSDGGDPSSNPERRSSANLVMSVPIFRSGLARKRIAQATIQFQSAQAQVEVTRRSVERRVRAAFQDVTSTIARVKALAEAVTASESALRARRDEYDVGVSTSLEVLNAQRDLFTARRDHLRARYDYILALLNLKRLAGTLGDGDVMGVNALLE